MNEALQFRVHWTKPHGPWMARFKDESGVMKSKKVPVHITHEDEARAFIVDWAANDRDTLVAPTALTVYDLIKKWEAWLKANPRKNVDAAVCAERIARLWVKPFAFGSLLAESVTLGDCVQWVEDIQVRARTPLTARNVVQQVRAAFSDARGKGWRAGENFFNDKYVKDMLRGAKRQKETVSFTLEQVNEIILYAGTSVPPIRHARNVLGLTTGMRHGEVAALRWSDIDLDSTPPVIRVERALLAKLTKRDAPVFGPPKKDSRRVIPLHPCAVAALRVWQGAWSKWVQREANADDAVFPDKEGRWVYGDYAEHFRIDLGLYGLPTAINGQTVIFHDVRSTCLTLLTDAGVPEGDIKSVAGHQQAGVTRRHYVALNLERIARGVESMPLGALKAEP